MQNRTLYQKPAVWLRAWKGVMGLGAGVALMMVALPVGVAAKKPVAPPDYGDPAQRLAAVVCGKFKNNAWRQIKVLPGAKAGMCEKMGWTRVLEVEEENADRITDPVGVTCSESPGLILTASEKLEDACRAYDGNEAECAKRFQSNGDGLPESCWYFRGMCLPCSKEMASLTTPTGPACMNHCQPLALQCADANRKIFGGWSSRYGSRGCGDIRDKGACNSSWVVAVAGEEGGVEYTVPCVWIGGCYPCDLTKEGTKVCINEGMERRACEENGDCDTNQQSGVCTWYSSYPTNVYKCRYYAGYGGYTWGDTCTVQGAVCPVSGEPPDGVCEKYCTNTCGVSPRCADAGRTYVDWCGSAPDGTSVDDEVKCKKYYTLGEFGPISCEFDRDADNCRACTLDADLFGLCNDSCN